MSPLSKWFGVSLLWLLWLPAAAPGFEPAPAASDAMADIERLREQMQFEAAAERVATLLAAESERSGSESDAAKSLRRLRDELNTLQKLVDRVAELKQAREFGVAAVEARRVLVLERAHYGADHPIVAECRTWCRSLEGLAEKQRAAWADLEEGASQSLRAGRLEEAIGLTVAVLKTKRRVLGNGHTEVAEALLWLARREEGTGRAEIAVTRFDEALRTLRAVLGPEHARVAEADLDQRTAARMARLSQDKQLDVVDIVVRGSVVFSETNPSRLTGAVSRLESDLKLVKKLLGTENRVYLSQLLDLGMVYRRLGRLSDADRVLHLATEETARVAGKTHPLFPTALSHWSLVRSELADHPAAVGYSQQAAEISETLFGPYDDEYLVRLHSYADLLYFAGRHEDALAEMKTLVERHLEVRGREHPDTGLMLSDLANMLLTNNDIDGARRYAQEAREAILAHGGAEQPRYLTNLNLLAQLADGSGETETARSYYRELLDISERVYGANHPRHAGFASSAAGHFQAQGDLERAAELLEQTITIRRQALDESFAAQSERHQLQKAIALRGTLFAYITCCAELGGRDAEIYKHLLSWKGAVSRQQAVANSGVASAKRRRLKQELSQVAAELSAAVFGADAAKTSAAPREALEQHWRRLGDLEQELAAMSNSSRPQAVATPEQLLERIPDDAALIDFYDYNHLVIGKTTPVIDFRREPRVLAFVLRPGHPIRMLQLGKLEPIEAAAKDWRRLLQNGRGDSATPTTGQTDRPQDLLRQVVWDPIAEHLDGVSMVLVSPDGPMNEIPLAALPGSAPDRYLIDELAVTTIPFADWLVDDSPAPATSRESRPSMLLVGDVDFGAGQLTASIGTRMANGRFASLPGTAQEIEELGDLFRGVFADGRLTVARGAKANESFIRKEAASHRYLHLATHGFFVLQTPSLLSGADEADEKGAAGHLVRYLETFVPELLSGIALAGANRSPAGRGTGADDDGILTALELSTLDLHNVDVAVLSACETALGQAETGEGMLGLQRALQVAGVRTAVTSLWKVDDAATQVLMGEFYRNLWQRKCSRIEALRQAQLTMLDRYDPRSRALGPRGLTLLKTEEGSASRRLPPLYWAAFCLSGDWR